MNLLSRATLAYIRALSPQAAAHLEAAGDMTPPRATRHDGPSSITGGSWRLSCEIAGMNRPTRKAM